MNEDFGPGGSSSTTPGEDLHGLLHRLGAGYGATPTPDGTLPSVVGRVRRRRAAKQVGVGAAACVVAGGAVVGGGQLGSRGTAHDVGPAAPAGPSVTAPLPGVFPTGSGDQPAFLGGTPLRCGMPVRAAVATADLRASIETATIADDGRDVPQVQVSTTRGSLPDSGVRLGLAWVRDGEVVAWEQPYEASQGHHDEALDGYGVLLDVATARTCPGLADGTGAPGDQLVAYGVVDGVGVAVSAPRDVHVDADGTVVLGAG